MTKLPSLQFYPGDWLRDSIAGCSLAAQGLWLRMMIIGHDSERYGYLQQNELPIPAESIARRCGCALSQYSVLLQELDAANVPSRTPDGIIFSRRMARDAELRKSWADSKKKQREIVSTACPQYVHQMSSASSSSTSKQDPPYPPSGGHIQHFEVYGQIVEIQMGRRRRLPKTAHLVGMRADEYVNFFNSRGLPSKIVALS